MKTITYEGVETEVKDWVNYIGAGFDGEIFGFELKPYIHKNRRGAETWRVQIGFVQRTGNSLVSFSSKAFPLQTIQRQV